jgi:beta-glucosidase
VQEQLLAAVATTSTPIAVVLVNGRPLTLAGVVADADAILEAWAPGLEAGNAIADLLFGTVNPGGKLPVTFPRAVGSVPYYYNHENTGRPPDPNNKYTSKYLDLPLGPQFEYGFGLSYTTFDITDLRLSSQRMSRHGTIEVTVQVANSGSVAGDEVVQLYIHDPVASIVQPVRRLRGFKRVTLAPKQSKRVPFVLTPADVGFYDNDARFVVESGEIEVYVGNSSAATLMSTFTVA